MTTKTIYKTAEVEVDVAVTREDIAELFPDYLPNLPDDFLQLIEFVAAGDIAAAQEVCAYMVACDNGEISAAWFRGKEKRSR